MRPDERARRLSSISTIWSVLRQAHAEQPEAAAAAQRLLLEHYGGAVYRYLRAAVGEAAADDLLQEFALCLVRGDFRQADPQRGRFRDYVKAVLFHLVSKHRKRQQKLPQALPADNPALAELAAAEGDGRAFDEGWRDQLLNRAWDALARQHPTFHTVLRFRAAHPKMASAEMAKRLGHDLGKPVTADWVRQTLRRARELFTELLIDEVAHSLEEPTAERVEDELRDLDLLPYCEPVLRRRHAPDT
jgi:RNA polymerase sigma-70 factor (ECF subfamily)